MATEDDAEITSTDGVADRSVRRAQRWITEAAAVSPDPAGGRLADALRDARGLDFTLAFVDQVVRPDGVGTAAWGLHRIGPNAPDTMPWYLRQAVRVGGVIAPVLPIPVLPLSRRAMRELVGDLIVEASPKRLAGALARVRTGAGEPDVTVVGAPVLGPKSAARHRAQIADVIARADVDHITISVASITEPLAPWDRAGSVDVLAGHLESLFDIAAAQPVPTSLTVEVERAHDLDRTIDAVTRVLDDERFVAAPAGIALPAALVDAPAALERITRWASERVEAGGAPVRVRLVAGAARSAERVDAVLHGWRTTAHEGIDGEAALLRLIDTALTRQRVAGVLVEVADHDPFRLAHAWELATERDVADSLRLVLLPSSTIGLATAVSRDTGETLRIVPVAHAAEHDVALTHIAYRLADEADSGDTVTGDTADLLSTGRMHYLDAVECAGGESLPVPEMQDRDHSLGHDPDTRITRDPSLGDDGLTQEVIGIARAATTSDTSPIATADAMLFGGTPFVETAVFHERERGSAASVVGRAFGEADADPTSPATRALADAVFAAVAADASSPEPTGEPGDLARADDGPNHLAAADGNDSAGATEPGDAEIADETDGEAVAADDAGDLDDLDDAVGVDGSALADDGADGGVALDAEVADVTDGESVDADDAGGLVDFDDAVDVDESALADDGADAGVARDAEVAHVTDGETADADDAGDLDDPDGAVDVDESTLADDGADAGVALDAEVDVADIAPESPLDAAAPHGVDDVGAGILRPASASPAEPADVDTILARARAAASRWAAVPAVERAHVLRLAAAGIRARRAELVAAVMSASGVVFAEADGEVVETLDAALHTAVAARELDAVAGAVFEPVAVTAVVVADAAAGPLVIPARAVFAALAAGSAVVLVPAAASVASLLIDVLRDAGLPDGLVTVVDTTSDEDPLTDVDAIVSHDDTDRVVLAGGGRALTTRVASRRPDQDVRATPDVLGASIVMPTADVDLAVGALVRSAFARSGRGRTTASLAVLVGAIARSTRFAEQLVDAVSSLHAGRPGDRRADLGPLPTADALAKPALTTLGDGEQWLVEPIDLGDGLWRPGVRVGVTEESDFVNAAPGAPVLGILHAENLTDAIDLVNVIGARVSALHTQDPADLATWLADIDAGSLFVNRDTLGTSPGRHPLVGWNGAQTGPGFADGGPNHLIGLGSWRPSAGTASASLHLRGLDSRISTLIEAAQPELDYASFDVLRRGALSDAVAWDREFSRVKDATGLGAERDLFRYRRVASALRATDEATLGELLRVVVAGVRAASPMTLSSPTGLPARVRRALGDLDITVFVESEEEWIGRMRQSAPPRVRVVGDGSERSRRRLLTALGGSTEVAVFAGPVTTAGRVELLPFLREQAITITAHRFGLPDAWSTVAI